MIWDFIANLIVLGVLSGSVMTGPLITFVILGEWFERRRK